MSQTEHGRGRRRSLQLRRSDSELAEAVRKHDEKWCVNDMARPPLQAANRLSEYAALQAKLLTVTCPTCGGDPDGLLPEHIEEPWTGNRVPCPNPDCDDGTVRLTLAQFVEACKPLIDSCPADVPLARWIEQLVALATPTHQAPGEDGLMPCCGRLPFEVARTHRMTTDPALVTCGRQP